MTEPQSPSIRLGSAILIIQNNQILLGKRFKEPNFGKWVLPGGKIEYGETHVDAAKREAKEELGLDVDVQGLAGKGLYYIMPPGQQRMIVYSFAKPVGGSIQPSDDISEARFFTREELKTLEITPVVREVLIDAGWL